MPKNVCPVFEYDQEKFRQENSNIIKTRVGGKIVLTKKKRPKTAYDFVLEKLNRSLNNCMGKNSFVEEKVEQRDES